MISRFRSRKFARHVLRYALTALLLSTGAAAHDGDGGGSDPRVHSVTPGGPADVAGLRAGDLLLLVEGRKVESEDDLRQIPVGRTPGETMALTVDRDGELLELSLTFGERADGSASLGLSVAVIGSNEPPRNAAEEGFEADECLDWIDRTYRLEEVSSGLGVDLADGWREARACVERDLAKMATPIPAPWCDNVFKIHCSGLDLLAELAEIQVARCKASLIESLDLDTDRDERWTRCAEQTIFDRYSMRGETTDETACRAVFLDECRGSSWSQWGGPSQDFRAPAGELAQSWSPDGPDTLWSRPLGEGQSAILYESGRLYTMYRAGESEVVVSLDAKSGDTLWERRYDSRYGGLTQYGSGPRATPLIDSNRLFTVGIGGRMHALDKDDGEVLWSQDLWGPELRGNALAHGYSSSPVAYRDTVVVAVGGERAGLVAFDQESGSVRWKSLDFRNSYSSPRIVEIAGREQILAFMAEELVGVDPSDGALLWRYPHANQWGHNISMPVVDGDRIFLSSPQAGARGLRLVPDGDSIVVEQIWSSRRIQLYHATAVREGDWVFSSTGTMGPAFMSAVNLRTGEIAWRERGMAKANSLGADGKLLILDEDGTLYLADAAPEQLEVLAETKLLDRPAWTVPTLVGTTLFARDQSRILAVDLG